MPPTSNEDRGVRTGRPPAASARPGAVVCAVADPRLDRALVEAAAALAARLGWRLALVHTRPPPLIAAEPQIAYASPQPDPRRELAAAARELARIAARAGAAPRTKIHAGFGDAGDELLRLAGREAAALVVLAGRDLPGSLPARARCPVLVFPREALPACGPARHRGARPADWGPPPMARGARGGEGGVMTAKEVGDVTRSILCGVDGSADSRLALRAAAQLAAQLDARLVVAHVVQTALVGPRLSPAAVMLPLGGEREAGERLLDVVLDEEGLEDVERHVVFGFPAERLADLADEEDAELIVVGSRGRGAFRAAFLGSVSSDLIGVARRPVLVVPPGVASEGVLDGPAAALNEVR